MHELGFTHCQTEHAVFYCYKDEDTLIVVVDVDNLTMEGNLQNTIATFKQQLGCIFKIKYLGKLHWLLGMQVKQDHTACTISFSQCAYIDKMLEKFGLHDARPLSSLLDLHHTLTSSQSPATPCQYDDMCVVPYHETIGSLMYAVLGMHPDIAFSVSFLSQFMQNPGRPHWEAVKRVFRYLKGMQDHSLVIGSSGHLK